MTGRTGAPRGTRNPFPLAYVAVTLVAAGLVAGGFQWAHPGPYVAQVRTLLPRAMESDATRPDVSGIHSQIPATAWGRVAHQQDQMVVTLGPAADRRRKYERSSGHVAFAAAGMAVSNDSGRTFFVLQGQPMGNCGYHWEGYGVNAILATRGCVPGWATSRGHHARQWLRIENLVPFARVVLVKFFY
jgi:hypothetical protein